MPELNTITGSDLHEPKGTDTASDKQVFVSDGAGSGAFKDIYLNGWENYQDVGTTAVPIDLTASGTFYDMTNDGAGAQTSSVYRLPTSTGMWDTATNRFNWAAGGLFVGDTVQIRLDVDLVNSATNGNIDINFDLGLGGTEYSLGVHSSYIKNATTLNVNRWFSLYMGDSNTLDNPAKFSVSSDSTGDTVIVNGFYIKATPRQPLFL